MLEIQLCGPHSAASFQRPTNESVMIITVCT